jgi:hypothetical protein
MSEREGIADIIWIDLAAQELQIRAADATEGRTDHDLSRARFERGKIDHAYHPRPGYHERASRHDEKLRHDGRDGGHFPRRTT